MSAPKHTAGRWVYTSACPKFEGDSNRVIGWNGSIHAGWENSPTFESAEAFYAWAGAECAKRNTLEAAAPDLLEAAMRAEAQFADLAAITVNGQHDARDIAAIEGLRAAIAKATGEGAS